MSPSLPDTSSGRKEKQPPNLEVSMGRLSKYPLAHGALHMAQEPDVHKAR